MIVVYRVMTLPDDYQCVTYSDSDAALFDLLSTGEPIGNRWTTPRLVLSGEAQKGLPVPDFPPMSFELLVASKRAWDAVRPFVGNAVEALPIVHPSGDQFYALNVTRIVDCLLIDHCLTNRLPGDSTGYFSAVHRYFFEENAIRGEHLFRCPEMKAFEIYASAEFKQLVKDVGLTGLKFKRIFPPRCKE